VSVVEQTRGALEVWGLGGGKGQGLSMVSVEGMGKQIDDQMKGERK